MNKKLPWRVYEGSKLIAAFATRSEARAYAKQGQLLYSSESAVSRQRFGILDDRDGIPFYKPYKAF